MSAVTRFTLGPWRRLGGRFIVAAHGAELPVCQVLPGGVGNEQADANERLIAAAPELYAALAAIVGKCRTPGLDRRIPPRLLDQAAAAIQFVQEGAA